MSRLQSLSTSGSALWSDGRGVILLAIAGGWGLSVGGRMIYSVLLPEIRQTYNIDLATAGILLSVLFLTYALGQLPGGLLADRIGEKSTLVLSMLLSAVAVALILLANSVTFLFVATGVFGLGIGLYTVARFTALSTIYSELFGTAVGLTNAASEIGQALLPPLAAAIAVTVGWQFGFGFTLPLFVLLAVALWVLVPSQQSDSVQAVDTLSVETVQYILRSLRHPQIVSGTAVFVIGVGIWQAFTGFYPTYLVEVKGLSTTTAGVLFGLFFAFSAIMHPLSGIVYDRWGVRHTIALSSISVVGFFSLPIIDGVILLIIATLILSTLLGYATALEAYLVGSLPDDMEGTGFGILRTFVFTIGAGSPILFGWVADQGYFDEVFVILGGLLVLMVVIGLQLPSSQYET